ncbi:hypothetical protein [Erythrobacter sp. NAP1]|uniref:hypothetical protein n=1 Tax=Erythrobacter sp. NAP1 TaxID=237727 RepID=UPI0012EB048A|nr:hypothetical protein [Erythrobacter sp. NAP1]
MTTRLTQAAVSRLDDEREPGTQVYDSEAKGCGSSSARRAPRTSTSGGSTTAPTGT